MAVASSLATTLSLLPLHHASAKSSFLSFSLLSPNLSLRLSRASSPRLYATPDDSDQFELDEGADDEDDSDQFELDEGADDEDDSDQFELDEGAVEEDDSEFTQPQDDLDKVMDDVGFDVDEEEDEDEDESTFVDIGGEDEVTTESSPVTTESPPRKKKSAKRRGKMPENYQIRIKMKSYFVPRIEEACKLILEAARATNAKTMGPVPLPTKRRIYCVLKSPHKHKDAREHFEIRTHQRLIDVIQPTAETVDSLMQIEFPAGVDVKVKV